MTQAHVWKSSPFTIEREKGKRPETVIFRFSGPFTARDMFGRLTPDALAEVLDLETTESGRPPAVHILDLTEVPYMDSTGLGTIVKHYVRCHGKGTRLIAAGANPRLIELFKLTRVDAIIPMVALVEEAEG
jgi:anti-anti-sigma factor